MALVVKRLPSWAAERKPRGVNDRVCDECGRVWSEIDLGTDRGPDDRGYVQLTGRIGVSVIRTVLCPACADDLVGVVEGQLDTLENIDYRRTELWEQAVAKAGDRILAFEQSLVRRGLTVIRGGVER